MFVDYAKIKVKAGDGGNGAATFHREKYVAAGGPDGGDGGRGGNVVFQADAHLSTLADFRYKRKYVAQNGENGRGGRCAGRGAPDLLVRVPRGTVIRDAATGRLLADLSDDQPVVIARGGRGGWGNTHFATPTRQVPRFAKPGTPGEELELQLELKLLADVGLVGFPNVGKSTLISVVSEARPNIANYHFTTLTPVLGVVAFPDGGSFVMADIPGLIEGASGGAGLGHRFLRHVDRCRLLVHVVDVSGSEGRDPKSDFAVIMEELEKFDAELAARPMIVAGNKCDMATDEQIQDFGDFVRAQGYDFFPIMAPIHYGVDELMQAVRARLAQLPPVTRYEPDPVVHVEPEQLGEHPVSVHREGDIYVVEGDWLLQIMRTVDFDDAESLRYFERVLSGCGVIDALRAAGCHEGDTVSIYDLSFDFVE